MEFTEVWASCEVKKGECETGLGETRLTRFCKTDSSYYDMSFLKQQVDRSEWTERDAYPELKMFGDKYGRVWTEERKRTSKDKHPRQLQWGGVILHDHYKMNDHQCSKKYGKSESGTCPAW